MTKEKAIQKFRRRPFQTRIHNSPHFSNEIDAADPHQACNAYVGHSYGFSNFLPVRPWLLRVPSAYMDNTNNNNFRVSNIRVSNRTLIYNVCPETALT